MSRTEIIHGSAGNKEGKAETTRWVINPWFVAIRPDHGTLDVPECGTWASGNYNRVVTVSNTGRRLEKLGSED